jgi:fluoride exporter
VTLLLVALGGAVGAPLRYLVDRAVQARHDSVFPWGTFAVNAAGSLILGLIAGFGGTVSSFVGVGFCGALTTYSTFSYETLRLLEERTRFYALANVVAGILAGLGAAFLGIALSGQQ